MLGQHLRNDFLYTRVSAPTPDRSHSLLHLRRVHLPFDIQRKKDLRDAYPDLLDAITDSSHFANPNPEDSNIVPTSTTETRPGNITLNTVHNLPAFFPIPWDHNLPASIFIPITSAVVTPPPNSPHLDWLFSDPLFETWCEAIFFHPSHFLPLWDPPKPIIEFGNYSEYQSARAVAALLAGDCFRKVGNDATAWSSITNSPDTLFNKDLPVPSALPKLSDFPAARPVHFDRATPTPQPPPAQGALQPSFTAQIIQRQPTSATLPAASSTPRNTSTHHTLKFLCAVYLPDAYPRPKELSASENKDLSRFSILNKHSTDLSIVIPDELKIPALTSSLQSFSTSIKQVYQWLRAHGLAYECIRAADWHGDNFFTEPILQTLHSGLFYDKDIDPTDPPPPTSSQPPNSFVSTLSARQTPLISRASQPPASKVWPTHDNSSLALSSLALTLVAPNSPRTPYSGKE
jgi:hypothetical protein